MGRPRRTETPRPPKVACAFDRLDRLPNWTILVGSVWARGRQRWTVGDGPTPDWVPMTDAQRVEHERWMGRISERGFDDGKA